MDHSNRKRKPNKPRTRTSRLPHFPPYVANAGTDLSRLPQVGSRASSPVCAHALEPGQEMMRRSTGASPLAKGVVGAQWTPAQASRGDAPRPSYLRDVPHEAGCEACSCTPMSLVSARTHYQLPCKPKFIPCAQKVDSLISNTGR